MPAMRAAADRGAVLVNRVDRWMSRLASTFLLGVFAGCVAPALIADLSGTLATWLRYTTAIGVGSVILTFLGAFVLLRLTRRWRDEGSLSHTQREHLDRAVTVLSAVCAAVAFFIAIVVIAGLARG